MNINIKASNTTLTPAIRQAVEDKIATLDNFFKEEDKVHVEFDVAKKHKSGDNFHVEIQVKPHGYFAEARGTDFYEALDLALPKIKDQMKKKKDKRITSRREKTSLKKIM